MALCLALVWTNVANYGWCDVTKDGSTILGKAPGNTFYTLDTATYGTISAPLFTRSGSYVGDPCLDADDKIWWLESPAADGLNYNLMRANLDGTSITTVVSSVSFSPAFGFVAMNLTYDPDNDFFWLQTQTGPRLRTLTKAGVATNRFTPPSSSIHYHNPLIDSQGGVWTRWGTKIYRTNNSTFTTLTPGTDSFGTSFPAVSLDLSGNGIVEDTGGTDVRYDWTGSAYNAVSSPCQIDKLAFGFTPSFSTGDRLSGIWYYEPGSSSPVVSSHLWGFFTPPAEPDVPPLRIYTRDDARSVGGARQNLGATSIQDSPRIRQGSGYL